MDNYEKARQLTLIMLKGNEITTELIEEKARLVIKMLQSEGNEGKIDVETLVRDIESRCNVWIGRGTVLEKPEDHIVWLPNRRSRINWRLWNRYRRYLEEEELWSEQTIIRMEDLTDQVLERLENPTREGPWDRRGMVVGQIQSGKTANYIGLICKAADAGYKLIVVLAGLHNNLRSQTQLRIDMGYLGFDTQLSRAFDQQNLRMGVGLLPGAEFVTVHSLTSSANNGDFNRKVAEQVGVLPGGAEPVILVVKKNKSVLRNLLMWALSVKGERDPQSGKTIVKNTPLLVIDDEADNASINTNPQPRDENGKILDDYNVTAINGLIRRLLDSFEQSAYVGYTATPFANIFIYPQGETDTHGEDLFPRSFIINLPVPSNHIGPAEVFGMDLDADAGLPSHEGLPIVRTIDDYQSSIPDGHKKDHVSESLPESLKQAIRCFILSCAARMARGQVNVHNSMLVHVTRYVAVQQKIVELVSEEMNRLRRRLQYGNGKSSQQLIEEMEFLWKYDYVSTMESVREIVRDDHLLIPLSWDEVSKYLYDAASRIQVKQINGTAKDILDYRDHVDGLFVIAIGGDKLSRGLTLEGLTVSYYLRASRMYDTLMQMGRWFGYRPGYVDLCRIFTTSELVDWYRHITLANEELRREFDYMADVGRTPEDYGLRVRTHPSGLLITAVNKMRSGTYMDMSYAGESAEITIFDKNEVNVKRNLRTLNSFIREIGAPASNRSGNIIWEHVEPHAIITLLKDISVHPDNRKFGLVREYIETQVRQKELIDWTVGLISRHDGRQFELGGYKVGLIRRSPTTKEGSRYCLNKGRLLSPPDELLDLTEEEIKRALELAPYNSKTGEPLERPQPGAIRQVRPKEKGLMLIYPLDPSEVGLTTPFMGLFFSFPASDTARLIGYKVNNIYWQEEFGEDQW
jgi:hypothetical protein